MKESSNEYRFWDAWPSIPTGPLESNKMGWVDLSKVKDVGKEKKNIKKKKKKGY